MKFWWLFFLVTLLGCNQEASLTGVESEPSNVSISAQDGLIIISANSEATIDLTDYVSSDKHGYYVSDVELQNGSVSCSEGFPLDTGFSTLIDGEAVCEYNYTVRSLEDDDTLARATIIAATEETIILNLITSITNVNTEYKIDIKAELGSDFPTGYKLTNDFTLLGGGVISSVDSENASFYFSSSTAGFVRIIYTLASTVDEKKLLVGTIDVSISDSSNNAPVANRDSVESATFSIDKTIDVASMVTDPDKDDKIQLLAVFSNTAKVALVDKHSLTNTKFSFSPDSGGDHVVSYIVTDHNGGFDIGTIAVKVKLPLLGRTGDSNGSVTFPELSEDGIRLSNVGSTGNVTDNPLLLKGVYDAHDGDNAFLTGIDEGYINPTRIFVHEVDLIQIGMRSKDKEEESYISSVRWSETSADRSWTMGGTMPEGSPVFEISCLNGYFGATFHYDAGKFLTGVEFLCN
ncbi:Ig-like domain-containing protein [Vibrio cionasavignyae]|uniref:Ig-like domain-containing protein n=1 Tax=Vibrio cionasavignyae TaxID=2910252 RepID=UPI003D116100